MGPVIIFQKFLAFFYSDKYRGLCRAHNKKTRKITTIISETFLLSSGKSEPFGQHDIIGCALNRETEEISFYKNGKDLGIAFSIRELHSGRFHI